MILLALTSAALLAAEPLTPGLPARPVITLGMSCYEAGARLRHYRQGFPDWVDPPPGPVFGCRGGKIVTIEPYQPALREFDGDMVIKPGPEPEGCKAVQQRVKDDQDVYRELLRGGRRPPAIWLVERGVAGCGVPTPMGYHPTYLLPGAADNPPKREDAPPNRR